MCFYRLEMKPVFILVLIVMLDTNLAALAQSYTRAQSNINRPVRVWGDITSTYRKREFNGGESTASNWLNIGTINASSYIWRPWFALVNGGLSLAVDKGETSEQESVKNKFASGDLNFDLFPTSRFPFGLYYNRNRAQLDTNLFDQDQTTSEYGIRQQFRSLDGTHHFLADYSNRTRENSDFDKSEGQRLTFSSNHNYRTHSFDSDIQFDSVDNVLQSEHVDSFSVTGLHSYSPRRNYTLESLVSTSQVESGFRQSISQVKTAQISSFLSWQPENRKDINLTANLRLSDLLLRQQDSALTGADELRETDNTTANINQGLLYRHTDHLFISQAINANFQESANQQLFIGTESIGFSYAPDIYTTGVGDYGWSVGSSFINQHGDTSSSRALDNQFNQSLSNDFSVPGKYQLNSNLTQSLGYGLQTSRDDDKRLNHSYTLTWTDSLIDVQSTIRFTISDSRAQQQQERVFQLANLQYLGLLRFSRYTQLSGNITLQSTRQKDGPTRSSRTLVNGQLIFSQLNVFQVPRLDFESDLRLNRQQSESEQAISAVNESSRIEQTWENSLDYRIGKLELSVNLDFIKIGDDYDRLFKIQLTRTFGDR